MYIGHTVVVLEQSKLIVLSQMDRIIISLLKQVMMQGRKFSVLASTAPAWHVR